MLFALLRRCLFPDSKQQELCLSLELSLQPLTYHNYMSRPCFPDFQNRQELLSATLCNYSLHALSALLPRQPLPEDSKLLIRIPTFGLLSPFFPPIFGCWLGHPHRPFCPPDRGGRPPQTVQIFAALCCLLLKQRCWGAVSPTSIVAGRSIRQIVLVATNSVDLCSFLNDAVSPWLLTGTTTAVQISLQLCICAYFACRGAPRAACATAAFLWSQQRNRSQGAIRGIS